ncbi:hypothetical protein ACFE04_019051 [Oxalis oulophora]
MMTSASYRDLQQPAVLIGGSFSIVAVLLSSYLSFQHLRSYTNPAEQKWIVAVLFMVPVYATESLLSLLNTNLSLPCDILRDCYEAFALYSFGSYLVACLGGERRVTELLENQSRKKLGLPLLQEEDNSNQSEQQSSLTNFFLQPLALGGNLLSIEKFGLVQYVSVEAQMILKTVCAFLALVLALFGDYCDGEFKWNCGYPYMAIVLNFSQMWALYCLVQFYNVTHDRLRPIKPLAKFISFKAIVFATWWQGMGIVLLCSFRVLPQDKRFQTGLQDFLICIEMAIAAVAHIFVFPVEPYQFLPVSEYGRIGTVTTKSVVKLGEADKAKPVIAETDMQVEAPGTSIRESVQDIFLEGGHRVVEDVVLTINQAIGPVEKGVNKFQETFHLKSVSSEDRLEDLELEVNKH